MSQTAGMQGERLDAIRSHLYANGFSTIQSLADSVGASLATIRRDLQVLEREGSIDRVHSGARIAAGSSLEVAVLGGQLRSENASLVGPQAEAMLESLWFDQLFLGASAVGPDGVIYSV